MKSGFSRAAYPLLLIVFAPALTSESEAADLAPPVPSEQSLPDTVSKQSISHEKISEVAVIRAALRSEVSQKPHLLFASKPNPVVMLTRVQNLQSGVVERS